MTKTQLVAAKARLVALCVEMGKNAGRSKMVEDILTILVTDPDFAGPFNGDNGMYCTVMGYSFPIRKGGEKANAFKLAVFELLEEYKATDKTYPAGYKSIKAIGIAIEQE